MDKSSEFYKFKQLWEKNNIALQSVLNSNEELEDKHYILGGTAILKQEDADNQKENTKVNNYKFKNQINKTEKDITIPLKSLPNRKREIKRSYKDLVPLETYNINKTLQNASLEIQNYVEVFEGATCEDKLKDLEVQKEVIFNQDGNEELLEIKAEYPDIESVKSEGE